MSWKESNAIKRIYYAFRRSKYKIYNEDVEALKVLNELVESNAKTLVNDNKLYAKLLCAYLRLYTEHYGDVKQAIRKASDELKLPLYGEIEFLKITLNNVDLRNFLDSINFKYDIPVKTEEIELKGHEKYILEKLKQSWSYENVEKSFYNTANDLLKDIENYN